MSIARRPRLLAAALVVLLASALMIPIGCARAGEQAGAPQNEAAGSLAPWWVDWLEAFDLDGNRIDDMAERKASAAIRAGNPSKLVPVLVTFATLPTDRDAFLGSVGAQNPYFYETQPVVDLDIPAAYLHQLETVAGIAAVEYDLQLFAQLDVAFGGRIAEEMIFGLDNTTTGLLFWSCDVACLFC